MGDHEVRDHHLLAEIERLKQHNLEQAQKMARLEFLLAHFDQTIADGLIPLSTVEKIIIDDGVIGENSNKVRHQLINSSLRIPPPSSCEELRAIGYNLDGFYLVQNSDSNKLETIYCLFRTSEGNIIRNKLI